MPVCSSAQSRKDNHKHRGNQQTVDSTPMIRQIAAFEIVSTREFTKNLRGSPQEELANNSACEGDRRQVVDSGRIGIDWKIVSGLSSVQEQGRGETAPDPYSLLRAVLTLEIELAI